MKTIRSPAMIASSLAVSYSVTQAQKKDKIKTGGIPPRSFMYREKWISGFNMKVSGDNLKTEYFLLPYPDIRY